MTGDLSWMDQAACLAHPDLPWTGDKATTTPDEVDGMRQVCWPCPVRSQCFQTSFGKTGGFWNGNFVDQDEPAQGVIPFPDIIPFTDPAQYVPTPFDPAAKALRDDEDDEQWWAA